MFSIVPVALYDTLGEDGCAYIINQCKCFTLVVPMESSIKFDSVKSGWSIVYIEGSQVIISKKYHISFS